MSTGLKVMFGLRLVKNSSCIIKGNKSNQPIHMFKNEVHPKFDLVSQRAFHGSNSILNDAIPFPSLFQDFAQAPIFIERFSSKGFSTTGGYTSIGPMLIVHGLPFQWDAGAAVSDLEFPIEALKAFEVVRPKPELILFGMGKFSKQVPKHVTKYLNSLGIQVEAMDTRNACSTYNVLIEEGRLVGAVVLPPVQPPSAKA